MFKFGIALMSAFFGACLGLYLSTTYQLTGEGLNYRAVEYYADGGVYSGKLDENGLANGRGILEWPNGNRYEGEFHNGMFHGQGKFTMVTGYSYEGDFENGQGQGYATIQFTDGAIYQGQIDRDLMHGKGKLTWPSGNSYKGDFLHDKIEGSGTWIDKDSHVYRGEVRDGLYHGKGEIIYQDGDRFTGSFIKGSYHGVGIYKTEDGSRYEGDYVEGSLTGKGTEEHADGSRYVGEFLDWEPHGEGIKTDEKGNQYIGRFEEGYLAGVGEYIGADGERYKGEFDYGRYSGKGEHWSADGEYYQGEFRYGVKHGKGRFVSKTEAGGKEEYSGRWRNGELVSAEGSITVHDPDVISEHFLYQQLPQLDQALAKLEQSKQGEVELYTLALAPYGAQEVFRREINFIEQFFSDHFDAVGHSIFLSNSRRSLQDRPLATLTSLEKSLQAMAEKMDIEQDILFLYVSSHGSEEKFISFNQPGLSLPDLTSNNLRDLLDKSGIKWRVIVLSACYSGGFIDDLKNDNTLIITAAAADRRSFGCSDDNDFTYFGKAYFKEALPNAKGFTQAFEQAKELINQWEKAEGKKPSNPQMVQGKAIQAQLEKWQPKI